MFDELKWCRVDVNRVKINRFHHLLRFPFGLLLGRHLSEEVEVVVVEGVDAGRLATLDGARIGFVWDYMFRGEEIFPILEAELKSRFTGIEIIGYDTFGNIHGGDQAARVKALPHVLAQYRVDAVVCGNGC